MPIYEYQCAECGFKDEVLQKVSEPPLTLCRSCGKEGLRKLVSAAGFQLKGSGWYATDFKGGAKADKPAAPAEKSGAKAESKPEPAAAPKAEAGTKPEKSAASTTN